MYARYIFFVGCVKDVFMGSLGLKRDCRKPCPKLAGEEQENCNKRFKDVLPIRCKNQMKRYRQNLKIEKKCKKSCNICQRKFWFRYKCVSVFILESHIIIISKIIINNINLDVKIDCDWSSWVIGRCSRSCGGGERRKTRVKTVKEQNGGKCNNKNSQIESCNTDSCPGKL